jgi:peroxiredoxin
MKRIAATVALTFGLLTAAGASAGMDSDRLLAVGDKAPAFTFSEVASGGAMTMDTVARGRPLLLVFLQTACQSCYREMQTLKQLRASSADFDVLGIFLDMKAKDFQKYIADNGLPFVFGWDSGYSIADSYGVSFTPASFLLDRDRTVAAVYRGFHPGIEQALKADLAKLTKK